MISIFPSFFNALVISHHTSKAQPLLKFRRGRRDSTTKIFAVTCLTPIHPVPHLVATEKMPQVLMVHAITQDRNMGIFFLSLMLTSVS